MRRLFILALMIGAMADQRAPQGVNPTGTGSPVHTPAYVNRSLLTLPVGDTVPILLIADSGRWGPSIYPGARHGDTGYPDWGYASDPYFYPGKYPDPYSLPPGPSVAMPVIQKAAESSPPIPTPAPPKPEMHEYHWPSSSSDSNSTTAYSIVSKDGRVLLAAAVWIEGSTLCYYTPDHTTGRILIDSIDRQETHRRNLQQKLNLRLPPEHRPDLSVTWDGA